MKLNLLVFSSAVIAACFACSSDNYTMESRPYASVETGDVTDITQEGSTLHGEFFQTGNLTIKDYGFIYNQDHDNVRLSDAERVSLGSTLQMKFSGVADHGLVNGDCWYKAYAIVGEKNLVVYGTEKRFIAKGGLAPSISAIIPSLGKAGDVVVIQGLAFSDRPFNLAVTFGGMPVPITAFSATSITCFVPFVVTGNVDVVVKIGANGTPSAPFKFTITN